MTEKKEEQTDVEKMTDQHDYNIFSLKNEFVFIQINNAFQFYIACTFCISVLPCGEKRKNIMV
jgi:hypothetical protein